MTETGPTPPPPTATYADRVQDALTDMRSSAKWILGAFAAVAALVFAGLQLTSLDKIDSATDPWRIPVAMVGFGLTVVGIIGAITAIARFLKREPLNAMRLVGAENGEGDRDLESAIAAIDGDPTILGTFPTTESLWVELNESVEQIRDPKSTAEERAAAQQNFAVVQQIFANVLQRASLVSSSRGFGRTLRWVGLCALLAAAGGGTYAVAVAQPASRQAQLPTLVRPLTEVTIDFKPDSPQIAAIEKAIGADCPLKARDGVVLEQSAADSFTVAVAAAPKCNAATLSVAAGDAVVQLPTPPTTAGS